MKQAFLVFLGGGMGSLARWLVALGAARCCGTAFPYGTLTVNILGCFIMGLFARLIPLPDLGGQNARLLLMTGVLGGFTTFSAFALDVAGLVTGEAGFKAGLYLVLSVGMSLLAVAAGLWLGGLIAAK